VTYVTNFCFILKIILIQNILNHHDSAFNGHDVIERAVQCMTNVARHINEMKHQYEYAVRTQEIQSLLYDWNGPDLVTLGDLILEVCKLIVVIYSGWSEPEHGKTTLFWRNFGVKTVRNCKQEHSK